MKFATTPASAGSERAKTLTLAVKGSDHETLYVLQVNDQLVDVLMKTIEGDDWEEICNSDGIRVCRNKLLPDLMIAGRPVRFFALDSCNFPST